MGQAMDCQDGDIVFLAEIFGGFGYEEGRLIAEVADTVEAEEFAIGFAGFGYSIGHHEQPISGVEVEAGFFVDYAGDYSQGKATGEGNFLAIEVGRRMAGAGDYQFAVGREIGDLAGGEAGTADENLVESVEELGGVGLRRAAERAHEHGDVHGRLQAVAGYVADDDEQAAVAGGLDVEEIAADFSGWGVDGVDVEAWGLRGFTRDHQLLDAAGCGEFAGGSFALAMDAEEADEDDEDDDEDADEVCHVREVNGNGAGLEG